jgi:hypothetical protein
MFLVQCINNKGKERLLKIKKIYSVVTVVDRNGILFYALREIPGLMFEADKFILLLPPGNVLKAENDNLEIKMAA